MAYYIFLKSLRSLNEFRKNPHVKIPPKSPSTNFQSLGKFKNPILIRNFFFLIFGPADPTARSASGPASPLARSLVASSWELRFPFQITPSRAGRLSLVSLSTEPHLSESHPSPRRLTPVGNFPAPPLPRAAAPRLGCPRAHTALPHHSPPLIPFKPSVNGP
jgi:hypothetical protein